MKKMSKISGLLLIAATALLFSSCKKEYSSTTGWEYNNAENGGFEVYPFVEQATGPGLVLIEGGTFTFGRVEEDVMYEWGNNPRRVTISSFYMDECEISNLDYREYLYWLERVFLPADLKTIVDEARPDENVWREKLAYAEKEVEYYFRYPAYNHYPVVGVNWLQATNYAAWRTDRVNEQILVDLGFIDWNPDPSPELYFSTDAYLVYDSYEMETDNRLTNISAGAMQVLVVHPPRRCHAVTGTLAENHKPPQRRGRRVESEGTSRQRTRHVTGLVDQRHIPHFHAGREIGYRIAGDGICTHGL